MENENEEKKVDTQTTGNDTQSNNNSNNQASKVDEIFGNSNENNKESKNNVTQVNNDKPNEKGKTDVANQNKNEGEKGKKVNNVAQKNNDGSITFKNQDELDGFIARMYAKGAEKATHKQKQGDPENDSKENETKEETPGQNQQNALPSDYYQNKIGIAMAVKGINPTKLQRASRLVDQEKVIVNGTVDEASLEEEINAIITEFPELVGGVNSTNEQRGFKFGATGNQTNATSNINDEIDEIFGNK